MPPPISPNSAHKTESFKPLFNPDFSSAKESYETQAPDSRDHSGFALKDAQQPSLQKLENKRSTPDPLDDFLKKQQDEDLPYVLSPAPGPMISVNPYVHEPKIEAFLEVAQTPLLSSATVQKGMQLLAKTQPPSLMLDQLSDQLDNQKINNPLKPLREGFSQGIAETLSSFSSAQNITLASATLMLSATPAEPYLGTAFTTALVPVVANSVKETVDAARQGDLKEVGRHVAHTMIGGVGLWVSAKGYLKEPNITSAQKPIELAPALKSKEIINTELLPLEAHETAGGHLIAKHVGKSEQELLNRLNQQKRIPMASSFFDIPMAQNAVNKTILSNQQRIQSWLQGSSKQLSIYFELSEPAGMGIVRGQSIQTLSKTRIVLIRDYNLPTGYRIDTGYLVP